MVSSYAVMYSDDCLRKLDKLDRKWRDRLINKSEKLEHFRELNTVSKMAGKEYDDIYRMRIGDMRVLFRVEEAKKTLWIIGFGFRGSVYQP